MRLEILFCFFLCQTIISYSQTQNTGCNSNAHKVVSPFLGEWEEYTITDSTEVFIGRLITKLDVEECVLTQSFMMSDSTFSYRSHGYINPASNIWEETYVFNNGGYSKYLWIVDGNSLYTLRIGGSRKTDYVHRLKYIDIKLNEYTVVQQESYNGGVSWTSNDSTRIKRVE